MAIPMRVLILEDEPADAELMVHVLRQAGLEPEWRRVDMEEDYVTSLELAPDVILADHRLPQFDSVRALARLRERGLDVPFLIVSGVIGQDLAVGLLEQGADDFVLKDQLGRLGPAVLRALERKRLRDEKQLAEQRLLASERRFRALIEHGSDGIVLFSPQAEILYSSPSSLRILGYAPEELVGRNVFDIMHPEDLASAHTQFNRLLVSPGGVVSGTRRVLHKDGSWRWLDWFGTNLLAEPDVRAIVINYRDITERKQFEETLREKTAELEAAKAKDRFLATISHELRTPLNAVIGFTGTLLMKLPGPLNVNQEKQLKVIQTSSRHLLALINDLLDLAKIDSGKVQITPESVACQKVVEDVITALSPLAESKGLELLSEVPTIEITLQTDHRALTQILLNLTNNALKFTEKGRVALALARIQDDGRPRIAFRVTDTGVGIRPEDQDRLFQAFERLGTAATARQEGTGLGLHVSQKLAHLLGGEIKVASTYGQGSTFTLLLKE
jgi:PAS domain S-box-containing protein